jgi:hypothetical protein
MEIYASSMIHVLKTHAGTAVNVELVKRTNQNTCALAQTYSMEINVKILIFVKMATIVKMVALA